MKNKLVAAILTALMAFSPVTVLATDLGDYPTMLSDSGVLDVYVVVGADADPSDVVGAVDLAARLAAESYEYVSSEGTVAVSGGKAEDMLIPLALSDTSAFGSPLDDDDIPGLFDGQISINNYIDSTTYKDTYDAHDELQMTSDLSTETGLTATNYHQDFKEATFLEVGQYSVKYYYVFDDTLDNGNYLSNATDDYPIEIDFLGNTLIISGASDTSMTVQSGTEYGLNIGESVTASGVTITLTNVGSDSIQVTVDGVSGVISENSQKLINGVTVKCKEIFYSTEKEDRAAVILVGEDVSDTVDDDDPYCLGVADKTACEDAETWVWDLAGLESGSPTIGIIYNDRLDDADEVVGIGEEFALPNDYMKIKLDSYVENDFKTYTIEADELVNLYNGTTSYAPSQRTIHIFGEGTSKDSITTATGSYETDDLYLRVNGTGVEVFYKDPDDNKIKWVETVTNNTAANNVAEFSYQDTTLDIDVDWYNYDGNVTFDTTATGANDLVINIERASEGDFRYLGETQGDTTTANDLMYGTIDISGWEENTRTPNGIIVYDPDSHLSGDTFEFGVNGDEADYKVNVVILGPSGSSEGGSGNIKKVVPVSTAVAKLDTEISDPATVGKDLVLVGGPAVNRLTAEAMGLSYPTYGDSGLLPFEAGEGYIEYKSNGFTTGQDVVIVCGWDAENTRDATSVLQQVDSFESQLSGNTAVKVTDVSASGITPV